MIWSRMAPNTMLLASVERKRGVLGAGKHRIIADVRDFLDAMKASSCCASHRRDFGLPDTSGYNGAMMWPIPGIKRC